jgi:hypothetical protein
MAGIGGARQGRLDLGRARGRGGGAAPELGLVDGGRLSSPRGPGVALAESRSREAVRCRARRAPHVVGVDVELAM